MKTYDPITEVIINDIILVKPQIPTRRSDSHDLKLVSDERLATELSGGLGALFIRFIYQELNIDEHHLFRWRIENKYIQYLIFTYFIPHCMPTTIALSILLYEGYTIDNIHKVRSLFKDKYFLKATLGHASRKNNSFDRTHDFESLLPFSTEGYFQNEQWIVQKKLDLKSEFRIHTFGKDVIKGFSFTTMGFSLTADHPNFVAESYVETILNDLPDSITSGSFIGWDIGQTTDGRFYVIEANFTGFHPIHCRGFQTSGYVDEKGFGPIICVWLNHFFNHKYKISVTSVDEWLIDNFNFYKKYLAYLQILKYEHFTKIFDKKGGEFISIIIYWDNVRSNALSDLVTYFQLVNIADYYYLIAVDETGRTLQETFQDNSRFSVLEERILLGNHQSNNNLTIEGRKRVCYNQLNKLVKTQAERCIYL